VATERSDIEPVLVPCCVWKASAELVVALDARFGEPLDTYVNGSQVWLRDDGPGGTVLEWRLHPVAGYRRPAGATTEEVFSSVALALGTGRRPVAPLETLWDGLEVFPANDEDVIAPLPLAAAGVEALGLEPDAVGLVDHRTISDEWERTSGRISVVTRLLVQLGA
jgi:hypothetical protein